MKATALPDRIVGPTEIGTAEKEMLRARRDRTKEIVREARREVEQSASASLGGEAAGGIGSMGGGSIQDPQGRLRWMWGVSTWTDSGESDVFSDV
jgi:hypothetical protein